MNVGKPLDHARLRRLLALGGIRHWKRHEPLFRAGDPMRALDDGRRQIIAVRAPGDCVGYLDSDGKYAFEGEALTDVEACAFDRRGFDAFAANHPTLPQP